MEGVDDQLTDMILTNKKKAEEIYALKNKPKADVAIQFPLLTHWPYIESPPSGV